MSTSKFNSASVICPIHIVLWEFTQNVSVTQATLSDLHLDLESTVPLRELRRALAPFWTACHNKVQIFRTQQLKTSMPLGPCTTVRGLFRKISISRRSFKSALRPRMKTLLADNTLRRGVCFQISFWNGGAIGLCQQLWKCVPTLRNPILLKIFHAHVLFDVIEQMKHLFGIFIPAYTVPVDKWSDRHVVQYRLSYSGLSFPFNEAWGELVWTSCITMIMVQLRLVELFRVMEACLCEGACRCEWKVWQTSKWEQEQYKVTWGREVVWSRHSTSRNFAPPRLSEL